MRKLPFKRRLSAQQRFEARLKPHFDALYAAARRLTLSAQDAEDLVQEVCIRAFERLEEFERIRYPRAWLLKVLYHRFVDDTRRAGRSPIDAASTGEDSQEPDELASNFEQPLVAVENSQRVEQVLRAMRCLNADQCTLLMLHDVEGFSIDELSKMAASPPGTIKAQLHRTRQKLGRLLSNEAVARPKLKVVGGRQ
jgi:RNA polymerase sigma-70 factor (ECF subfamily)